MCPCQYYFENSPLLDAKAQQHLHVLRVWSLDVDCTWHIQYVYAILSPVERKDERKMTRLAEKHNFHV